MEGWMCFRDLGSWLESPGSRVPENGRANLPKCSYIAGFSAGLHSPTLFLGFPSPL